MCVGVKDGCEKLLLDVSALIARVIPHSNFLTRKKVCRATEIEIQRSLRRYKYNDISNAIGGSVYSLEGEPVAEAIARNSATI